MRAFFPLIGAVGADLDSRVEYAVKELQQVHARFESLVIPHCTPMPFPVDSGVNKADLCYAPTIRMARRILSEFGIDLRLRDAIARWLDAVDGVPAVARSQTMMSNALEGWISSKS